MAELNNVRATVTLAGKEIEYSYLQLSQAFGDHHRFEIHAHYKNFGNRWMEEPIDVLNLINTEVFIVFQMSRTGEQNLFEGLITGVNFSGCHGTENMIILTGADNSIRLEGQANYDSFTDLPLQNIVQEAVANSGNGGSVIVNPKFKSKLDYICQNGENCWSFLQKLAWNFGEALYSTGQQCYFGLQSGETEDLEYDKELTYFDLGAKLVPSKFKRFQYVKNEDRVMSEEDPSHVPGVHGYLQIAKKRSEDFYTSEVAAPIAADVNFKDELDKLVLAEKSRATSEMLIMRGKSQSCRVRIGGSVKIELPGYMKVRQSVDRFLVTKIVHTIKKDGSYENEFEAVIDEMEVIPTEEPKLPVAYSQTAVVVDNADPKNKGRVKVQMLWQKDKNKTTNWLLVCTPDAGGSDKVSSNRGLVTIPEVGDTVMVGFEYGNPDRPYVASSIFTAKTGGGGGAGNKSRSLKTKSGIALDLDDSKGSATLTDPSDNVVTLNGDGTISITAPNKITISSKEIIIDGSDLVNIVSKTLIKEESMQNIESFAMQKVEIRGLNKVEIKSIASIEESALKVDVTGNTELNLSGTTTNINGETITNVKGGTLNLN